MRISAIVARYVASLLALFVVSAGWAHAQQGMSAHFDRELAQYLATAGDSPSLSITGDITVEAWIRLDSEGADGIDSPIVAKYERTLGTTSFKFVVQNLSLNGSPLQRQIQFYLSGDGGGQNVVYTTSEYSPATGGLPLNEWVHVAATWSAGPGNRPRLYVNGVETAVGDTAGSITSIFDGDLATSIGSEDLATPSGSFYDGDIADVRIWNMVRSTQQIRRDMRSNSPSGSGQAAFWRLNGDLTDATGNANTLINPTGVTFVAGRP